MEAEISNAVSETLQLGAVFYHVTPAENLEQILREGLQPRIGDRSEEIGETTPAVYLFTSAEAVEEACMNWLPDYFDEDTELALLEVRVGASLQPTPGVEFEAVSLDAISAGALRVLSDDVMSEVSIDAIVALSPRIQASPGF